MNNKLFFVPLPIPVPKLRLFCFPYAGGSTAAYLPWAKHFGSEVELVLVQPPGRGARTTEKPHDNMESLLAEIIENASYITSIPYILFGHSLGCRIAYELISQLDHLCMPLPEYLIASGSRAPHLPSKSKNIHTLPVDSFVAELKRLNGTPKEILDNQELMALLVPLLRADFKIAENYQAQKLIIPTPITVLSGEQDTDISSDQIEAWAELSSKGCNVIKFPGDHFFIHQNSHDVLSTVKSIVDNIVVSVE